MKKREVMDSNSKTFEKDADYQALLEWIASLITQKDGKLSTRVRIQLTTFSQSDEAK